MPFFKVQVVSKIEKEVIVEAENMNFAITKAFDVIRDKKVTIPYTGLYFEEAHAFKMPDMMTVGEIMDLGEIPIIHN